MNSISSHRLEYGKIYKQTAEGTDRILKRSTERKKLGMKRKMDEKIKHRIDY